MVTEKPERANWVEAASPAAPAPITITLEILDINQTGSKSRRLNICNSQPLKAQLHSDGGPQVVVPSMIEVHLVPGLQSKSDRPGEGFDATARVHSEIRCPTIQSYRTGKTICWTLITVAEIVEANFTRDEKTEGSRTRLKFRTGMGEPPPQIITKARCYVRQRTLRPQRDRCNEE